MIGYKFDKLLSVYFYRHETPSLQSLEQDVLRRIRLEAAENSVPWYENIILACSAPQFYAVSLTLALLMGITLSPVFALKETASTPLGLEVFTLNAPYLAKNMILNAHE